MIQLITLSLHSAGQTVSSSSASKSIISLEKGAPLCHSYDFSRRITTELRQKATIESIDLSALQSQAESQSANDKEQTELVHRSLVEAVQKAIDSAQT